MVLLAALAGCTTVPKYAPVPSHVTIHHVDTFEQAAQAAVAYAQTIKGAEFGHVATDSMEPYFPAKRTVFVSEPGDPLVGQPVRFQYKGRRYIHMVKSKGLGRYETTGTNVQKPDAGYRTKEDILGPVRHVWVAKNP